MDWANERYVRLYTRDTADDLVLSWQASGLWPLLVRKADRAGVIATNHGARGVAALVRWPLEVTEPALSELLDDGRIRVCATPRGYVIPNYLAAQETPSSDAQRQRESRERRRDVANTSVTKRDEKSRTVTPSHTASHAVTPSLPSLSDPSRAGPSHLGDGGGFFDFGTPPPSPPAPATPKGKPRSKATQLPPDWQPAPYAIPRGVDVARELERFRNHALGKGRTQVDWQAAWRNWLLKAEEYARSRSPAQGVGGIRTNLQPL